MESNLTSGLFARNEVTETTPSMLPSDPPLTSPQEEEEIIFLLLWNHRETPIEFSASLKGESEPRGIWISSDDLLGVLSKQETVKTNRMNVNPLILSHFLKHVTGSMSKVSFYASQPSLVGGLGEISEKLIGSLSQGVDEDHFECGDGHLVIACRDIGGLFNLRIRGEAAVCTVT